MLFSSRQIKGEGRGKKIGWPTINLIIPDDLVIDDGVYAAWVVIDHKTFKGALHYGPIPTFNEKEKTLEVYLLDVDDDNVPVILDKVIEVDVVLKLRDIKTFDTAGEYRV